MRAEVIRLLLCMTLATVTVTIQTSPQRVERLQEWRWCVGPDAQTGMERAAFVKRTTMIVDGVRTAPTDERLVSIDEHDARFWGGP